MPFIRAGSAGANHARTFVERSFTSRKTPDLPDPGFFYGSLGIGVVLAESVLRTLSVNTTDNPRDPLLFLPGMVKSFP
jgi:hypothetical protein